MCNNEGYHDPTASTALGNIERDNRLARWAETLRRVSGYRPLVYICSPYAGDVDRNTHRARSFCRYATEQNRIPIAPHLLFPQFLNDADEEQRALGIFMGCVLMTKCAEVWVFGNNISSGMAMEIEKAEKRGMIIRYFTINCEEASA